MRLTALTLALSVQFFGCTQQAEWETLPPAGVDTPLWKLDNCGNYVFYCVEDNFLSMAVTPYTGWGGTGTNTHDTAIWKTTAPSGDLVLPYGKNTLYLVDENKNAIRADIPNGFVKSFYDSTGESSMGADNLLTELKEVVRLSEGMDDVQEWLKRKPEFESLENAGKFSTPDGDDGKES